MSANEPVVEIKERIRAELALPPFAALIGLQNATLSPSALHGYIPQEQHRIAPLFVEGDPYHLHVPAPASGTKHRFAATLVSRTDQRQGGWQLRFAFADHVAEEVLPLLSLWQRQKTEYDDERDTSL